MAGGLVIWRRAAGLGNADKRNRVKPTDLDGPADESTRHMAERTRRDAAARDEVRKRYPRLFAAISEATFRHDPIGINFAVNPEEYDPETGTILPRLADCRSADEATTVVYEEFCRWFSPDIAGDRARYTAVASEIWGLWTLSEGHTPVSTSRPR